MVGAEEIVSKERLAEALVLIGRSGYKVKPTTEAYDKSPVKEPVGKVVEKPESMGTNSSKHVSISPPSAVLSSSSLRAEGCHDRVRITPGLESNDERSGMDKNKNCHEGV